MFKELLNKVKNLSKKNKIMIIMAIVIVLLVIFILIMNSYIDKLLDNTNTVEVNTKNITKVEDQTDNSHEVVNFMLVGADNLDTATGRTKSYKEERSDVFKIISLDYTDKKIKITSLDRDIVVWIPPKNEFGRFNWAYSYGGAEYAFDTINYNLDLNVDKYVSFSFAGFINVIDKIGGIDVELTAEEAKKFNSYGDDSVRMKIKAVEGENHLNGYDALVYARQRKIDNDFVRMTRQNTIIKKVITKVKGLSYREMLELVNDCLPYVSTNLTSDEIKQYITDVLTFDLSNIETHTFPTNGSKDVSINPDSLGGYILRDYFGQVIDLHMFIYGTDSYNPTENIYNLEKKIYSTYGEFKENSELLP